MQEPVLIDIPIEGYFRGDEEHTSSEYKEMLASALKNIPNGYALSASGGRYKILLKTEADSEYLSSLEEEEKRILFMKEKTLALLYTELARKETLLESLDYIGIKIATGRASREEYASEIETMNQIAAEIDNLRLQIQSLENTSPPENE